MQNKIILFFLFILVTSCNFFKKTEGKAAIARVNDTYLYLEDIKGLVSEDASKEDSMLVVQNFINRWATQQLFIDGAKVNLSQLKQDEFNKLIQQYKNDLYTKAYIEALVKRDMDTVVTNQQADKFYKQNKDVFRLNEELVKFRYIKVDANALNFSSILEKFKRFNSKDKKDLNAMAMQFKSYSFNDTIWIKSSQVINKISAFTPENKNELLKKSNFIQLKDSLGVYLMQINDVLLRNDTAPLVYVRPTIDQIVINKRKLELITKLEKDITTDAIKNKQFEIYK